jgi:hypothetical protein
MDEIEANRKGLCRKFDLEIFENENLSDEEKLEWSKMFEEEANRTVAQKMLQYELMKPLLEEWSQKFCAERAEKVLPFLIQEEERKTPGFAKFLEANRQRKQVEQEKALHTEVENLCDSLYENWHYPIRFGDTNLSQREKQMLTKTQEAVLLFKSRGYDLKVEDFLNLLKEVIPSDFESRNFTQAGRDFAGRLENFVKKVEENLEPKPERIKLGGENR